MLAARSKRPFDVIVWGATGFTGQLTCKYINDNYPSLKWAMSGRHLDKLRKVKKDLGIDDEVPILSADINVPDSLDVIFKDSKVVLSTAGPYAKIGTEIIRSCVLITVI